MKFTQNIIIFIIFFLPIMVNCQSRKYEALINNIIENSLIQDIYYYFDFNKNEEIPQPKFFYSNEKIPLNIKRFKVNGNINSQIIDDFDFKNFSELKKNSGYIVFNSGLIDNSIVMVEIFFIRDEFFNIPNSSEYETWKRNNGGMSYLFEFNNEGCLMKLNKKAISYD